MPRGFAGMSLEKRTAIARKGGASVPANKRSFARSRDLASAAGRKGGLKSAGGPEAESRWLMTTKNSPDRDLRAQANKIACALKDQDGPEMARARARSGSTTRVGIVMDDKTIIVEIPWSVIRSTDTEAFAEYVFDLMKETRRGPLA